MTLHYGRLVLILQVSSMAFKVVSLKQITGSPAETRLCQMQRKQNSYFLKPSKRFLIVHIRCSIFFFFFLLGTKIKEAVNEKILGVILDKHLDWTNHIYSMITKLKYMPLPLRKLLYIALIKSILEYCCCVWGNSANK